MDWKNKIEFPNIESGGCLALFWDQVSKSEEFIRHYIFDSDWLPVSSSNCEYGSIEDYIELYSKKNEVECRDLFLKNDIVNDSPLERALYMAASQRVLFDKCDGKFYFDYTMGPHSEYRIYFLRRLEE